MWLDSDRTIPSGEAVVASKAQSRGPCARAGLVERVFECSLWNGRLLVLIAVVASLCESIGMFYVTTIDTVRHLMKLTSYAATVTGSEDGLASLRATTITGVVETIDGYLLATVMLMFAYGLYELFISRIDTAESSDRASRVLVIHSLDDLKHRLAQVILLILVVRFFEQVLNNAAPVIDLVLLSSGIVLIAFALRLGAADKAEGKPMGRALQTKVADCVNEVESP
jgi:uncharacterized membrane protein YqhA